MDTRFNQEGKTAKNKLGEQLSIYDMPKIKKPKKIWPKESEIQNTILEWLLMHRIWAWRNNSGMMFKQYNGKSYAVRLGLKGSSDILGVIPPDGRFLAIEVKDHKGKVSPEQMEFLETISGKGGIAFVARTLEDVIDKFK